jgi:hypothetical protein
MTGSILLAGFLLKKSRPFVFAHSGPNLWFVVLSRLSAPSQFRTGIWVAKHRFWDERTARTFRWWGTKQPLLCLFEAV